MNFGEAIEAIKLGKGVQRHGWHGKGMHVSLYDSDGMKPCMVLTLPDGSKQPGWNASTADVLAEDWSTT